jgi:hypothetical protein
VSQDPGWHDIAREQLPDFLIIGAMKCGTTSLAAYLESHPGIFMSRIPEPGLYLPWPELQRRVRDLAGIELSSRAELLAAMRDGHDGHALLGERGTYYTKAPFQARDVPAVLHAQAPHSRLLYVVRHPLARIVSHYHHARRYGGLRPGLNAFLDQHFDLLLAISCYHAQISRYLEYFPREQLRVVVLEELANPVRARQIMQELFSFLGLDPALADPQLEERHHAAPQLDRVCFEPGMLTRLRTRLEADILSLPELLGYAPDWDLSAERWC